MLTISSNVNSLIAQENLNSSGSALTQAITRLSSGKRINSAADDPAGLAISTTLQSSINGLTQGVSNANDAVSMVETASTGLSQITTSLQTIGQLADESAAGTLSSTNQAALQQEVAQQVDEINRLSSQTTYNGINLLNGTAGNVSVQIGADVGQTISINLSQGVSAASIGSGAVSSGTVVGSVSGLDLTSTGAANSSGGAGAITTINVVANGTGGFTYTDQNNQAISSSVAASLFTVTGSPNGISTISLTSGAGNGLSLNNELGAINAATGSAAGLPTTAGTVYGTLSGLDINPTTGSTASAGTANAITSITVESNGAGGYSFFDQNGNQLSSTAASAIFGSTATASTSTALAFSATPYSTIYGSASTGGGTSTASANDPTALQSINYLNQPSSIANVDVSTTMGANLAIESVNNALASINNIQATLGAVQNRLTDISTSQQAESTDLSSANSQIIDANYAQETANYTAASVAQQAGISVLAQANSQPQQVLSLLQNL
ncbi:flagellin N-terminal helical domain-containing protein [Paraburkholderia acidipaludis]|uniref:flagellin N-terminal helical domain-containing protein n=1 Tax=Paraburkholderia acidipaludis TaxID=660537 RepID=UPI000480251F|nr:flagellin [Paraburkholderia acidipaludis]